jgi:hypothetical protein
MMVRDLNFIALTFLASGQSRSVPKDEWLHRREIKEDAVCRITAKTPDRK